MKLLVYRLNVLLLLQLLVPLRKYVLLLHKIQIMSSRLNHYTPERYLSSIKNCELYSNDYKLKTALMVYTYVPTNILCSVNQKLFALYTRYCCTIVELFYTGYQKQKIE